MDIRDKVFKLISEATKVEMTSIQDGTSFVDDLNLDSLDMVELMMKMEDEFGVEIPEDDTDKLKTVKDVIEYLSHK